MAQQFELERGLLVEDGRAAICRVRGFRNDRSGVDRLLTLLNEAAALRSELIECRAKLAQAGVS